MDLSFLKPALMERKPGAVKPATKIL